MTLAQLKNWFASFDYPHLVLGYGSLMNADSRQRFSAIEHQGVMVTVNNFYRAWVTRSWQERQTYVGALPENGASLNAQLIPTPLSPALAEREKDYTFTDVPADTISTDFDDDAHDYLISRLADKQLWICQTFDVHVADPQFPVSQTYIDTCLAGCLSHGGLAQAEAFIRLTRHWPTDIRADRSEPFYPRPGRLSKEELRQIDTLLAEWTNG
ncbi:hypothetical protein [Salinimonas chungwhensis]|uniref:hypothetical protein n=1 Tax=Salinimonas chungwhensis TaxID=265425 RepID=UPI00037B6276|nr:hypothetical protein [Salinimonas chungwhensis]